MVKYVFMDQAKFSESTDPLKPLNVIEIDSANPNHNYSFEQKYGSSHKTIYLLHFLQEFWKRQSPELYAKAKLFDFGYLPVVCFLERRQPPHLHHDDETQWDWLMDELSVIFDPNEYRLREAYECFQMDNLMQMELRSGLRKLSRQHSW